jgi:hypothetical protein
MKKPTPIAETPRTPRATLAPLVGLALVLVASFARPQEGEFEPADPVDPAMSGGAAEVKDWSGAVRVLRVPGATGPGPAEARAAQEIFPDADKVWMHVYGTDPRPIEGARRGTRPWICSEGCDLTADAGSSPAATTDAGTHAANIGDWMLRSIKIQTPTQPLPLTIWRPNAKGGVSRTDTFSGATTTGQLLFDPVLLGRRSYKHVRAYPPVTAKGKPGEEVRVLGEGRQMMPTPDSAEMVLGFQWPQTSELAAFQYIAITDTCGNARVVPFQRTFTAPVYHVASGGCGNADGRVLRVFPSGGWMRVTAFNLDTPAAGNVVSATFRVTVPPLEDLVSANTPPLLFPDPRPDDLVVDCGPQILKARTGEGGIPREPGDALPGQKAPPGKSLPGQTPPPGKKLPGQTPPPGMGGGGGDGPPVVKQPRGVIAASSPTAQPLAHQALVIAPEPLQRGNCRIELRGQAKRRLVAPLALHIEIDRTDKVGTPNIHRGDWIVTPSDSTYYIPPLRFDGESRLSIQVYSDPLGPEGNVVLLSDAGRIARFENTSLFQTNPRRLRRLIGQVTVHSAPLCGDQNFETAEAAGSCLRGYFTVPAMLATLQVTRAPWVEKPLVTRNVLSAIGLAFAVDSYDPVERRAFPIALQVGGFVQDLGEKRVGLLSYIGIAPTIPVLGEGGNTTSIGVLGGIGIEYITNSDGPDEGFKPAAFLSLVVQVGQANPAAAARSYGAAEEPPPSDAFGNTYEEPNYGNETD